MRATVFYDFIDDGEKPIWYVLEFNQPIIWEGTFYFKPTAPFEKKESQEFDENLAGATVLMADMKQSLEHAGYLGIELPRIKERLIKEGLYHDHIHVLIMQVGDIEEVMQLNSY